ncbi:hypothetical protein [Desulfogranum mediterraneum]|uniref:hypothetical protein n=1 Tax=Desulfogranum mediterraneum TaxID=160661 RepID=UPI0004231AB5|nr:hypothetical protein [Desulfogranum mediterraneum]
MKGRVRSASAPSSSAGQGAGLLSPLGSKLSTRGYCARCGQVHSLPQGPARTAAQLLMTRLEEHGCLDWQLPLARRRPQCRTDYLLGPARGKMFGVLVGLDGEDREVCLSAFSGQYNGLWSVEGWVEPVFAPQAFQALTRVQEQEIKAMGRELAQLAPDSLPYRRLRARRKRHSQRLMSQIHQLYRLTNLRGVSAQLTEVFSSSGAPPAGTADCCAPKLLHHAAIRKIRPTGLAEFYWGRENRAQTRSQGIFYPPCPEKCAPILGFLLCGVEGP